MDLPKGFSQDGNGRDPRKRRLRKLSFALLAGLAALVLCATWYWLASPYSIEMSEKNPINAAPNSGATRESMTLPDRTVLARAPEEARKSDKPDDEAQRRKQDEARTLRFQAPTSASDGHDGSGSPAPLSDGTYAGPRSEGYRPPSPPLPAPVSATAAKPDFDTPDVVVGGLQGGQSSTAGNIRPRAANESPDTNPFSKMSAPPSPQRTRAAHESGSPATKHFQRGLGLGHSAFGMRSMAARGIAPGSGQPGGIVLGHVSHAAHHRDLDTPGNRSPHPEEKAIAAWVPRVVTTAVSRYADFDGPDTAEVGQPFPIVFALKEQQTEEEKQSQALVKTEPDAGSALTPEGKLTFKLDSSKDYWDIDVDLTATGFIAKDSRWTGRIRLPRHGDSEKVRFVLTPRAGMLGQKWMTLRLWHDGQPLGSVSRPIEVAEHASPGSEIQPVTSRPSPVDSPAKAYPSGLTKASLGEVKKSTPQVLIGGPSNGSDLEVSIQYDDPDKLGPALLIIRSPHKNEQVVAQINTPPALRDYLEREYERLLSIGDEAESDEDDGNKQSKKDRLIASTEAIGNNLYREYVPQQLKDAILSLESNNELASMQISTNSPVFPWELVFPDKRGNGAKPEFFGITFRLARWSVRNSFAQLEDPVPLLNFAQLHAFAPPYTDAASLPAQQREIASLKQAKGFQMHESNFTSLKLLMGTHIDGFVHFTGHGDYAPSTKKLPLYSIMLSDGVLDPLTWRQMAQGAAFGNPFVFFNACDTGRSRSYGGFVQGWGPVILSTGAGGFLGAMWPLLDDAAADFAQGFYDELSSSQDEGGVFVADVLRDVRRRFYTTGDPTYLAYVFYGNANLRVSTPSQ